MYGAAFLFRFEIAIIKHKGMKNLIILLLFISGVFTLNAQDNILIDPVTSHVFDSQRYSEIRGTPFLMDKWTRGSVTIHRGVYKNQQLKLDVYNNTLLFEKDEGSYEFYEPVLGFALMPNPSDSSSYMYFIKGISSNGLKPEQYVQVLAKGRLNFYRSDIKLLSDMNEINKGVVQIFNNSTRYYFQDSTQTQIMKLSQKDILGLMNDKKAIVEEYMNRNKLNLKKEKDVAELVKYYNSLLN